MADGYISTKRLRKKDGKHIHPKTGERLDLGEGDFFALVIENREVVPGEGSEELISMLLTRATLEQVKQGIEGALESREVSIRLA